MGKPREMMEPYTFDVELLLACMVVGFVGRHPSDLCLRRATLHSHLGNKK